MMLITGLLRYGVFDEFGFSGDQEYPNYFTIADRSFSLFVILSSRSTNPYVVQSPIIPYYKMGRMMAVIFVSQDLPDWYKQCNAHWLLDPQVRKEPISK